MRGMKTTNSEGLSFMRLDVYRAAREMVVAVRDLGIAGAELRDQAKRASSSVLLNLSEGLPMSDGSRRRHLEIARASAHEVAAAVDAAAALGDVDPGAAETVLRLCDRVSAMVWRLRHR
jgi:four helix bundle protein